MNKFFAEYLDIILNVYLDHFFAHSNTWQEHLKHILKVLEKLCEQKPLRKNVQVLLQSPKIRLLRRIITTI